MEKDGPTFPGGPTFSRRRGFNCIFLYKPIEFVIFQGGWALDRCQSEGSEKKDKILNPHWIADHASFMLGYTDGISNTVSLVSP